VLQVTLSNADGTAAGGAPIAGAADNAPLDIVLDRPLPPGRPLRWRISQTGQTHPVAVWIYDAVGTPRFSTALNVPGFAPELVSTSATKEIYRLPGAAPFWQAAGCGFAQAGWDAVRAVCAAPASLLRRELFFPGWRARVNGTEAAIRQDGLFQRIDLPAGPSDVQFDYAPPGIGWAYLAALAGGVLALGLALSGVGGGGPGRVLARTFRGAPAGRPRLAGDEIHAGDEDEVGDRVQRVG
jgi:hypothetical protein